MPIASSAEVTPPDRDRHGGSASVAFWLLRPCDVLTNLMLFVAPRVIPARALGKSANIPAPILCVPDMLLHLATSLSIWASCGTWRLEQHLGAAKQSCIKRLTKQGCYSDSTVTYITDCSAKNGPPLA